MDGAATRRALIGLAVAAWATTLQAQVALNWTRNYELPEATDGDCATDAVAHLSDGRVVASMHTLSPSGVSRFVQYTLTGAQAWSRKWGPSDQTTYPVALVSAVDDTHFAGLRTSIAGPGISLVSVSPNGDLRWTAFVAAQVGVTARLYGALDAAGAILVTTTEGAGLGPTLWAGFSASGATLFTHRVELDPAAPERVRGAKSAEGGLAIVGDVGSRAIIAMLAANGQVRWSHEYAGLSSLGADGGGLDVDANGRIGAAGVATLASGQRAVWLRILEPNGEFVAAEQWSIGGSVHAHVGAVRFASDGAMWIGGWKLDAAGHGRFFALRRPRDGGAPKFFEWIQKSGSQERTLLLPGAAGQMWAVTPFVTAPPTSAERVAVIQLTHELDAGVNLRATFGDGVEARMARAASLYAGERLAVGGRSDQFLSGPIFFDPLAWVAQFDLRGAPEGYCVAQLNSDGCEPELVYSGAPSIARTSGFVVRVERVLPQRSGLYFYGAGGAANTPWQGGTLCIAGALRRAPLLTSSGVVGAACGGAFTFDWNTFTAGLAGGAPGPELLAVGSTVRVQLFSRDPQSSSGSNVSSALRYVVLP